MLVEINRLMIESNGYKRDVSIQKMYVNSDSIVSISDYQGASSFLLRENSSFAKDKFSLIRINQGGRTEDIIALGSADQIYATIGKNATGKRLLND